MPQHTTAIPSPKRQVLKFAQSATARRLRRDTFLRDDFTCQRCGYRPPNAPGPEYDGRYSVGPWERAPLLPDFIGARYLQLDHIFPLCAGGALKDPENLQTLCNTCNSIKNGKLDG